MIISYLTLKVTYKPVELALMNKPGVKNNSCIIGKCKDCPNKWTCNILREKKIRFQRLDIFYFSTLENELFCFLARNELGDQKHFKLYTYL